MIGGPGWVIPGVLKMLAGALLAYLAIGYAVPLDRAVDPTQMCLVAYNAVFSQYGLAVAATALFVFVSGCSPGASSGRGASPNCCRASRGCSGARSRSGSPAAPFSRSSSR